MEELGFKRGRLRVARELVGLSQAQLAAQVGVSPAAISQFESGSTRPSADSLGRLADTLRVPVNFFSRPKSTVEAARQ